MLGQTLRSLLAAALAIAAGGCTTDETNATTGDPTLQPPVTITLSVANPNRCCAQAFEGPDTAHPFVLPIQVQVEGADASSFVLRPPGYCRFGGLAKCGHLVAALGPFASQESVEQKCGALADAGASSAVKRSSTTLIEVPLGGLGDVSLVVRACSDAGDKLLAESPILTVSAQTSCVAPIDDVAPCPPPISSDAGADGG